MVGLQTEFQESWGIGFFGFFGTVTAFGNIWIDLIGFFGTVTVFYCFGIDFIDFA